MDPYRVLGVSRHATPEQQLDAYRRLVKLHHPDRPGGSAERFAEIHAAYQAVRDRAPTVDERLTTLEEELRGTRAAREQSRQAVDSVSDLIDGLDDLASRLDGL